MNITTLQGIVAAPALPMLPDHAIDWSTCARTCAGSQTSALPRSR